MHVTGNFLQLLWVGSYYLAAVSIIIFLVMIFIRLIADRKNLEKLKRTRTLRHKLMAHLGNPDTDIRSIITLQKGDAAILLSILQELSEALFGKRKETFLKFLVDLGIYDKAVRQLRSRRLPKRLIAIRTLSHWSDRNTKRYLLRFLDSRNILIQATVIDTLARMKSIELLPRIISIAQKLENLSQPMLTDIFTKFGVEAAPVYVELAGRKDMPLRLRIAAILALGNLMPPRLADMLMPLMEDQEYEIRANLLRIFEKVRDPAIIPAIQMGLADDSWIVRLRATYCAKQMPSETYLGLLEHCLHDSHWLVEQRAIEALHAIRNPEAMGILESLSKEHSVAGRHATMLLQQGGFV
jgi:HEAT repeat protein